MPRNKYEEEVFQHGSKWLRADFHLHTNADKEFDYTDDKNHYNSNYVQALVDAKIGIGSITNHNKFDYTEYKALKETARKKGILLLPGVELSINDGTNGIHILIVFSDEWLINGKDRINPFLQTVFQGKTPAEYENENGQTTMNLEQTIRKLEELGQDFFVIFAHVEQRNGFWKEMGGNRIEELGKKDFFRKRCLGFQKVVTHDVPDKHCRKKVKGWLGSAYPAEVEGSDPKSIEQIGKGKNHYIKIGAFSFEAVKYALLDKENRTTSPKITSHHSHINSIQFKGGILDEQTIFLSSGLNCLIGIRGSGKSAILESIRYTLDLKFGNKTQDKDYKSDLIEFTLGSGGKLAIKGIDPTEKEFRIERIVGENPNVFYEDEYKQGVSISETSLYHPLYFGQKDLAATGDGFERDLIEKLVGSKLDDVRSRITTQANHVIEIKERIDKLANLHDLESEITDKKNDAEFKLDAFKGFGVEESLSRQLNFDADVSHVEKLMNDASLFLKEIEEFIKKNRNRFESGLDYKSEENKKLLDAFHKTFNGVIEVVTRIETSLDSAKVEFEKADKLKNDIVSKRDQLKEEFAEIKRKIDAELRDKNVPQTISPDTFASLRKLIRECVDAKEKLEKDKASKQELETQLGTALVRLNDAWHEEFIAIKDETEKINESQEPLELKIEYKKDKESMITTLKDHLKGSGVRETAMKKIVDKYPDFISIFKDLDVICNDIGTTGEKFREFFERSSSELLIWQPPNKYTIHFRGRELRHHSIGQRASALILFILSQKENQLILIDQPEDDLDNQTVYEDVIKAIRELKGDTQFIFATHNANFPVLGDAEKIIACDFNGKNMDIVSGSIDDPEMQKKIVSIMEGGPEAFKKRQEIYQAWNQ